MTHYSTLVHQLPQRLQIEVAAHLGPISGMSELQITTRYKDVAWWLRSVKLATLPPGYSPHRGHLTAQEFSGLGAPVGVAPEIAEITNQFIAYESAWHLENFVHQLSAVIAQIHEAARLHAQRQAEEAARQIAQRQAEEAARQLAQRQAEEAARLHAQRMAEEAARQLAQRQAEEAAQLAARQLAQQQAETAARALAQHRAEKTALEEMRRALELKPAPGSQAVQAPAVISKESPPKTSDAHPAKEIVFIPGPTAMAEIERATLVLKHSIDAAVVQYASAIGPYLNTSPVPAATAR
jgi:flagellar biosynthesis GTPase FlhF